MKKVLLNTNVLQYYINADGEYYKKAVSIIENTEYQMFVTNKNVTEFCAVLTKLGVEWTKIQNYLDEILDFAELLFVNKDSLLIFRQLCTKYQPKGNRIFDFEIASVAKSYDIKKIATFNHKDFREITEIEILLDCLT